MHRFTLMKSVVFALVVAVVGLLGISLLQSEQAAAADDGASQVAVPTPPIAFFISTSSSVKIGTLKAADEDILQYVPSTDEFSLYFDGSDAGIAKVDIDALELIDEGDFGAILMSFDKPIKMTIDGTPKVLVDDSDIVKFTFIAEPGANTSGIFTTCFDGSAFDLTTSGEDIDAITFDQDGRLVISTDGTAKVNGTSLTVADEDLLVLGAGAFDCDTAAGPWSLYVDGSDLALTTGSEDIGGAWIDQSVSDNNLYLSTKGNFAAADGFNAVSGDSDDIFGATLITTGDNTTAAFFTAFDGDVVGLKKAIDAIFGLPGGTAIQLASSNTVESAAFDAVEQFEVLPDDADAADAELDEYDSTLDPLEAEEIESAIFLPLVTIQ